MYLDHFGLREFPFRLTPDTEFFFPGSPHQEALNTLLVALEGGEGFLKIVGEVGTGKTMILRKLLTTLPDSSPWVTAWIPAPDLGPRALLVALAQELKLKPQKIADTRLLRQMLYRRLLNLATMGKRVVVLIDEAQAMPLKTLETLRLLSNLETEKAKLLHIVLFGQPELDELLKQRSVRQLATRISAHYRLTHLSRAETCAYVAHRIGQAGHPGPLFTPNALNWLYAASGGFPRMINVVAHKAMMLAFGRGRSQIHSAHVVTAAQDTLSVRRRPWWRAVGAGLCLGTSSRIPAEQSA